MVNVACPLPTEPKMKFESRTVIDWFRSGNTSFSATGPSITGTGGSGGAGLGVMPRSNVGAAGFAKTSAEAAVGAGAGGLGDGADWHAATSRTIAERAVRMR